MQDELTSIVTRGFESVSIQLKERDDRVARIQETLIRLEGKVENMGSTVSRLDGEMSRSENEGLKIKVTNLENSIKELKAQQEANSLWVRGLLVTVIFTLLGVVFNFVMARLK